MTYLVRDDVVDAEGRSTNELGIKGDSAARLGATPSFGHLANCEFRQCPFSPLAP